MIFYIFFVILGLLLGCVFFISFSESLVAGNILDVVIFGNRLLGLLLMGGLLLLLLDLLLLVVRKLVDELLLCLELVLVRGVGLLLHDVFGEIPLVVE